jgi:hypothetical protein
MKFKDLLNRVVDKLSVSRKSKEDKFIRFVCYAYFEFISSCIKDKEIEHPISIPNLVLFCIRNNFGNPIELKSKLNGEEHKFTVKFIDVAKDAGYQFIKEYTHK